jgi:hypothetical protein
MLKDRKGFIYGGAILTVPVIISTFVPSEETICVDPRVMCAPAPIQMADQQSGDEPQPTQSPSATIITTGSTATVSPPFGVIIRSRGAA